MIPAPANAQARVPAHEIDINNVTGACTLRLVPSARTGDAPPILVFRTEGKARPDSLSISVSQPGGTGAVELVRRNARVDFTGISRMSGERIQRSDFWEMLEAYNKEGTPFYLTGKLVGGGYASARYDEIDPKGIISVLESQCAFRSTAITAKTPEQLAADERTLRLTADDIRHIRWVLARKYSARDSAPPERSDLNRVERGFLERYSKSAGMPETRYLTAELAARLLRERFDPVRPNLSRRSNYRTHKEWITYTEDGGKTCVMVTFATHWNGADLYAAPKMQFAAKRTDSRDLLYIDMLLPNPFRSGTSVTAFVDGKRFSLQQDRGHLKPREVGDGLSDDVIRAILHGQRAEIRGTPKSGGSAIFYFSAQGFTAAWEKMMDQCNRHGLRAWLQ